MSELALENENKSIYQLNGINALESLKKNGNFGI